MLKMCVKISLHIIKKHYNVRRREWNSFALIESDWVFSTGFFSWIKSISYIKHSGFPLTLLRTVFWKPNCANLGFRCVSHKPQKVTWIWPWSHVSRLRFRFERQWHCLEVRKLCQRFSLVLKPTRPKICFPLSRWSRSLLSTRLQLGELTTTLLHVSL